MGRLFEKKRDVEKNLHLVCWEKRLDLFSRLLLLLCYICSKSEKRDFLTTDAALFHRLLVEHF